MCGIAGELAIESHGLRASRSRVERMSREIARRGPDGQGLWGGTDESCNRIVMSHRRLAILDLSEAGAQPMRDDEADLTIVFNGTIFNWRELRAQLAVLGHRFISCSDTEVLLRAWKQWGEQALDRLDGVFAFAVWDGRQQALFVARDRLGIKPVYYQCDGRFFRFCSTTRGLLASGAVDTSLDKAALAMHFSLHGVVPPPRTVLASVRKLAPGHLMRIDADARPSLRRWWTMQPAEPAADAGEWRERTWELLVSAVRKRYEVSDTPVGVLLSGGLDSSLIVAVLAHLGHKVKTYSIGFEDVSDEQGSEFYYSDQVVSRYGTDHCRWVMPNRDLLSRLGEVVDIMTEPMPAQDCAGFYLLSERVSADVKVVLSGQGADEVFAGYFWYPQMKAAVGSDWDRFAQFYVDRSSEQYRELISEPFHAEPGCRSLFEQSMGEAAAACGDDFVNRLLYFDMTTLITDDPVKRVDNMCLGFGLEARVPFLDAELVQGVCAMPSSLKLAQGGKGVLRDLARTLLPAEVIDRHKGYFPVPALKHIQGSFLDMILDTLGSRACRERGLYRRGAIDALARDPDQAGSYTPLQGNKLWHCALLEMWLQGMDDLAARSNIGDAD